MTKNQNVRPDYCSDHIPHPQVPIIGHCFLQQLPLTSAIYMDTTGIPDTIVNLAAFLPRSESNGPGLRAVLWVQGCPLRCPGCFNPDFIPVRRATPVTVPELAERILSVPDIEGATFSGGEPFAQAAALASLGCVLRDHGLNVVTFTGYTVQELEGEPHPGTDALINATDLLVAGPFRSTPAEKGKSPGVAGKTFIYRTPRLRRRIFGPDTLCRTIEYLIHPDGVIVTTGFPEQQAPGFPQNTESLPSLE